ncbi:MAG: hypothetical protein J0H80_22350, partial [Rhizobiales bacterium]|nr:hypothetical protein [Hyphomicrobiales bacterium]
ARGAGAGLCAQAEAVALAASHLMKRSVDERRSLKHSFGQRATFLKLGPGRDVQLHLAAREIGTAVDTKAGCFAELEHDAAISAFAVVGIRQGGDQGHDQAGYEHSKTHG